MGHIENELDKLYSNIFNKDELRKNFSTNEISKISAPFLLKIDEEKYLNSKTKILFIGKETNKWWGKLKHFIEFDNSIEIMKLRYKSEFEGGVVIASDGIGNLDGVKKYKAKNWGSNAFFSKYKYIQEQTKDLDSYVVWTELLKCDSGEKGSSRNSNHIKSIVELSIKTLKQEIDILKPDYIIFVTATSKNTKEYDDIIKKVCDGYVTDNNSIIKGKYWKFKYQDIQCYRTLHPLSYQFSKNKSVDFYKKIIEDIKQI